MKFYWHKSVWVIGVIIGLGIIGLLAVPVSSRAAPDTSPQAIISHAWELARQSGSYNFTTRLVQTTHPAPSISNVGRGPRVETIYIEGETDLTENMLLMRMWQDGGRISDPNSAAEVRVENGQAYGRQGTSAWQEIDDFTGSIAPGNDASAFLVAARNVEHVQATYVAPRFTFDISGPALATYLRDQLEDQLRSNGELPTGLHLDAPEQFRNTVGDGEVWLDAAGLPQRMKVHLEYPQQANGERTEIEMQTDFANFDQAAIASLQSPATRLSSSVSGLLTKARDPEVLLSFSVLGLLSLALFNSRSKKVYAAIVIAVILSMLFTPLLQSAQVYAFNQKQAERQDEQDLQQAEQEATLEIQDELYGNNWDPHSAPAAQVSMDAERLSISSLPSPFTGLQTASAASSDTSDDDNDGLTGDDDPCPDDADCDDDGLLDGQEYRLGTNPEEKDTDGDYITDNAEVAGFWYNNQWWYSDPVNPDTNNDGINDGAECSVKAVDEDKLSPEDNACEDRDGDGTPDIFDRDNDDDLVPDRADISPNSAVFQEDGSSFDGENPLQLQVDALQSDLPVFLDIQLRPQNEDHLWHALNVLDWPSGDEDGQVMRRAGNDSTFEDVDDPADNAANGDMRLIPMLEIKIPYKDGHYANLPVLDGAPARDKDNLDDWLDRDALSDYGISVRKMNDDGDLVAYAPLNLIEDETGGNRVAFGGRMFYWPTNEGESGSTDWGNTQEVRVVWLVQMLADYVCTAQQDEDGECTEGEWVTDSPQIVRGYDEDWYLTGLSVREDHGLEIAIAYEDPAEEESDEDRQYDDWLWALAYGLDQTFLTGRDEDEDGERDITIDEIQARFDNRVNGGTSDEERWDIPSEAFQVETFSYDHEDYFVHVMMTETQRILTDNFDAWREQGAEAPTLLFAQEARYRSVNLGDGDQVAQDSNLLRIDVDPEAVQQHVRTFVSWAPYRYNEDADGWENYPIDEYMDKMEVRLKDSFDEYEDEPDYEDILRGQVLLAQSHYLSLYTGAMRVVQIGDDLVGNYGEEQNDSEMAEWLNGAEIDKAGGIMSRQAYTLANTIARIAKYYKGMDNLFKDLGVTNQGGYKATMKHLWQNASWKKLKLGASIAGAVIAMGALVTALALYGQGNGRAAILVLDAVMLGIAVLDVLYTTRSIIKAAKVANTLGKSTKLQELMKAKGMKYSGKAFAIGTIVAAVIILAAFLIAWGVSGERWDTLAFTMGLASVLSSIITMVILMAIAAIPIVGQIIAAVIFLLDVIFQIVCHAQDREDDDFFCQGISGYVAQGVRWTIFSQNIMVKLDDDNFLRITDFEQEFEDLEAGMSEGNSLRTTITTTHQIQTLPAKEMSGWMPWLYRWQYSDKNTKSTTFSPHLDASSQDYNNLKRGRVSNAWAEVGDYFELEQTTDTSIPLDTTGINQPARLYLNDGYAFPAQECWLMINPLALLAIGPPVIPVCYVRSFNDTININLGKNLHYDVFPATFDEFMELTVKEGGYALAWSQDTSPSFPRLKDADGDGLRNKTDGGADPNDLLWDSDLDQLSDFYEHESGSDPLDIDSDDDGLNDYEEALLGTDPNRSDSDYDGLTDKEEVDGWEFVYDFAEDGSQLATWVTSDPLSIDGDGDNFSDFQEKTYGFHPRVKSDPNILTLETQVNENFAPQLLLRLDETLGSTAFGDNSGYANNANCVGVHCPVAGHYGKYSNAPHFDGVDDYIEVSDHENLTPDTELTLAAWLYLSNSNADQKIIGKTSTNDGFVLGVGNGQLYPEIWDSQGTRYYAHWGSIPTETWTHLALTWQSGGQMIGYINGVEVGSIAASSHPIGENNLPLRIGIAPWNATAWPVEGRLDEVLLFPRALSATEIQQQAAGRYNPEDLSVRPGDELFYEATVTNELFNRYAQGLLSTRFPAAFSELPPQDFVLNPQESEALSGIVTVGSAPSGVYTLTQEADALITDWREDSGYAEARYRFSDADTLLEDSSGSQPPRDGECDAGHCPTLATGRYGNGVQFDGTDDYVSADAVADILADAPALSFGGWVYPESGMTANGVMLSFHTPGGGNLLMLQYDPTGADAEKFIAYDKDLGDVYSTNTFATGQWYHVMFVIYEGSSNNAYLYVNGVEEARFSSQTRPESDGRFSLGQEWDGNTASNFFRGRLDEIVVYPRALSESEIQELFNNPIFHLPLDEGVGAHTFKDDSGFENAATCSGSDCPQSGVAGISQNAVQFDGQDHLTVADSPTLDLSATDFTLSAWVYPEGDSSISDCPFRTEYFTNEYLSPEDDTQRQCENYPIDHDWGAGGWGSSYYQKNSFSVRWTGTFFFEEGDHTFTFTTDDGMRAWLDSDQLLNEWHTQSETTYHVDRSVNAGWHTVKVEYFEHAKDAVAKVSWTPGPLPQPQGIFGAEDYPAIQRVGNHLRLVLNSDTDFLTDSEVLTPGAWNHVASSFDGNTWFLYVNGVEVDQFNVTGETPASGQGFEIGRVDSTAQLELETLLTLRLQNGDYPFNSWPELRMEVQIDGESWQTVWENHHAYSDDEYPINFQTDYSESANIRLERTDYPYNNGMGTENLQALDNSPHESVTHFENDKGEADLFWSSRIDSVPFEGKIDEVAIYKTALLANQISDLYDAGTLVLRLPVNDAPGASDFADALGQHNGSCSGNTCPTAGVPGREEMALLFDGLDDYVTINEVGTADLDKLTIAAWVRPDSTPSGIMRFVTVGNEKAVLRYENNELDFYISALAVPNPIIEHLRFTPGWQAGNWYHVAASYDGHTMRLYLNGAEVASQVINSELMGEVNLVLLSHPTEALDGALDEIRLYRRALSAAEIQELYSAAPEMLLLLDEEGQTTSFGDATGNNHTGSCSGNTCPDAGAKGQMGLAALFDGENDYLEIPHNAALNPGAEMTLITWVKLEDTDPDQKLVGKSTTSDGYILGVQDGQLYPEVWDSSGARYSDQWGQITAGYWTQVAITWESGGDLVGYINGQEAGRMAASANPIGNNTSPLRVGIAPWNASSFPANGRLDQVTLYTRALSPLEIRETFRLQAKWVEDRQHVEIKVDNNDPASTLVSDDVYRPNQDVVLLVNTSDATSAVTLVEMGLQSPGASGYTWTSVPPCEDSQNGTAWCPTFEPTAGEGLYLLQFRATDNVGNRENPTQIYTILVDDTPPQADTDIPEGQIVRAELQPDHSWLLPLSGTVADPQIAGSAGSGVADVTIKLTDTDPVTDTLPLLRADFGGGLWQADYPLLEADATGTYELSIKMTDQMGNSTEQITLITLSTDTAPPKASLNDITAQTGLTGTITTTLQIGGQITETNEIITGINDLQLSIIPAAMESFSGTVGIFHFEEPAGSDSFGNRVGLEKATCEAPACPLAGEPGVWGTALSFDASEDQYLSADAVSAAITDTRGFAFGGWVYPTDEIVGIMVFEDASGNLRNQIRYSGGFVYRDPDTDNVWGSPISGENHWYHIMVSIDEAGNGFMYVNGQIDKTFHTTSRPDPNGHFRIGYGWDNSSRDFLNGRIDEVRVYDRALSAAEIHQIYANTTLDASGSGVAQTNWNATIPEGLDGLYQINLKPGDIYSNSAPSNQWPVWKGMIDTRGPDVELTIVEKREEIADLAGQPIFNIATTYTCWAQDFNLQADQFECPCQTLAPDSTAISTTFYHEVSPWYAEVFTDTARLWEYQGTCTVPGLATDNFMEACDSFGRCSTDVADVDQLVEEIAVAYSLVITPAHQTVLPNTGDIDIEGRAYARDRIQQVNLYDGVAPIGTVPVDLSCTGNITTTQWTHSWSATEGHHNLSAQVVPCTGDTSDSLVNQVDVDSLPPLVGIFRTSLNRDQRLSYGRVRLSGPASDATSGLALVEVSIDGSNWAEASFDDSSWQWDWYLGEEPDNATYNVTVRATDRAGWIAQTSETVIVDLDVPNPITMTLEANSQVITPGITIRTLPTTLNLSWEASEPTEKLLRYDVRWQPDTPAIPVLPGGLLTSQYVAVEAQRVDPQVTSVFLDGNTQVDNWGPVYIDTPLTPDYVSMAEDGFAGPYRGWMDSGCTNLGVDRRVNENAPDGVALADPQNLYVTWDTEGLRLAWVGANWDYDGDLFIYLDDLTDPSVPLTAYNPFTETQETMINIPGGKAFIWVQDSFKAQLSLWNGSDFENAYLTPEQYLFTPGLNGGTTDLYIPFDLLGISDPALTPLVLFAFATDEGQMRLWATQPAQNPVNSPNVVSTDIYARIQQTLEWLHVYAWPNLGMGICPNNPLNLEVYTDADLRFDIRTQPEGTAYGLQSSDLFWLADQLTSLTRTVDLSQQFTFMDVDHLPIGEGDVLSYTLSFANHGTYTATDVTVQAVGLYALEFMGEVDEAITVTIGDIPPGAAGSVTFYGYVDTNVPYNECLAQPGGNSVTCQPYRDWAVLNAIVSDSAYGSWGNPLDWLWVDHQVDVQGPEFFGILEPEALIRAGVNTLSGYAFDVSGVSAVTLEVQPPSGGSYPIQCLDDTPFDGVWSCDWDAGAAAEGQIFQISLQAEDRYGNASARSEPYFFTVDATPPEISLSAATQAYSATIVNKAAVSFSGSASDNRDLDWSEACVNGMCRAANTLMNREPSFTFNDDNGDGTTIGACGGGELVRTFTVTETFSLRGLSLGFNADHPQRDDLQVTLESPEGTIVQLIAPPTGTASEYANFDLNLGDANLNGLHTYKGDDDTGEPYYDRLARPAEPLEAFRGEGAAGDWTLTICDLNPDENEGSYNRAQLSLWPQNQAVTAADWSYTQTGLEDQDYVPHTLEAYAYDRVGNQSAAVTLNFWVDNVAPELSVTETVALAATGFAPEPIRLLAGTVSDGGEVQQLYALALSPSGKRLSLQVGRNGDQWWFDLTPQEAGEYLLWVNAVDAAGNAVSAGPFTATIVRVLAENDGPTALGSTTAITATVLGDDATTYSFDWDFGDGGAASDQPSAVSHLYAGVDVYTATVTANKGSDVFTATTVVIVDETISNLIAINDSPAFFGDTTALTATISTGSNVTYAWDFGDGQPSAMDDQAATLHNYAAGTYTATVTASNSVSSMSATTQVQLVDLMAFNDSPTEVGRTTTFTATLLGNTTTAYEWDFGDGTVISDQEPVTHHNYPLPDIYTATVAVETVAGVISTTTAVTVTGLGVVNDSPTALGSATTFTAATSLTGTITYEWDFGNQSTVINGPGTVVSHTYPAAGIYTAVITATNGSQVLTTTSQAFIDGQAPSVSITDPVEGQVISTTTYIIQGIATDDIGLGLVEISTDNGQTWHPATGLENWTYEWIIPPEDRVSYTLLARATDQAGYRTISEPVAVEVRYQQTLWLYLPLIMR